MTVWYPTVPIRSGKPQHFGAYGRKVDGWFRLERVVGLEICVFQIVETAAESLWIVKARLPEKSQDLQPLFQAGESMIRWKTEGGLVHWIAGA